MFLAIKEILHEKVRYGLIVTMVVLTSYLMFLLMGMMFGLASENTVAIESWGTKAVVLDKNANVSLSQSLIAPSQLPKLTKHEAELGLVPVVMETVGQKESHKTSLQFVGLKEDQFIAKDKLAITSGHRVQRSNQLVLDESLKDKGYRLGSKVKFGNSATEYTVVGFAKDAKLNISSIAYGDLSVWQSLRGVGNQFVASGIISDQAKPAVTAGLASYSVNTFIEKLPGYSAQNTVFEFMIGFLMVISVIIIAVFLYILTMQKLANYAVLRAQGIPAQRLINATLGQALILMVVGVIIALLLTVVTGAVLPTAVPILFNWPLTIGVAVALVVMGVIGALLPVRVIKKIDPLDALN